MTIRKIETIRYEITPDAQDAAFRGISVSQEGARLGLTHDAKPISVQIQTPAQARELADSLLKAAMYMEEQEKASQRGSREALEAVKNLTAA